MQKFTRGFQKTLKSVAEGNIHSDGEWKQMLCMLGLQIIILSRQSCLPGFRMQLYKTADPFCLTQASNVLGNMGFYLLPSVNIKFSYTDNIICMDTN